MPRVKIPNTLSPKEKEKLLYHLEQIGTNNFHKYMSQKLLGGLSVEDLGNKEFLARYLLLAATLDQQADSTSAKETVVRIYSFYGADFFMQPEKYVMKLHDVIEFASEIYKPKTRVLRMKNESVLLLRIGGFLLTVSNIANRYDGLINYFNKASTPMNLLKLILEDPLISGLLYEKAARMYTGWISHPKLWINISNGRWGVHEIPMAINGHVCKIFSRTGFLSSVLVEDAQRYIVKAEDERTNVEKEVDTVYPSGDRVMIDFGTFYIGLTYCKEERPQCDHCPISTLCKRNIQFRAY